MEKKSVVLSSRKLMLQWAKAGDLEKKRILQDIKDLLCRPTRTLPKQSLKHPNEHED